MATFTLNTQKRLFGDPNVLPKKPGYDYRARADEAWRVIGETLDTIRQVAERLDQTEQRRMQGSTWVAGNTEHDRFMEGYQTLNELYNDCRNLSLNLRSLERVVWNNCMTLYACLYHSDREGWLTDSGVTFDALSPASIWQAVMPGREQPGSYPAEKQEKYIERKVNYTGWKLKEDAR